MSDLILFFLGLYVFITILLGCKLRHAQDEDSCAELPPAPRPMRLGHSNPEFRT